MKTRKQPVVKQVPQVGKKAGNVVERQVESRVTHSYLKEDEYDVSKLDLIFRSEPQQIQAKLMKLLISYNAHMQYNHQTDMFEVDLLLPFLNEQQKRQFVKQFLEIRKQKQIVTPGPQIQVDDRDSEVREPVSSQPSSKSKDNRRFSFNIKEQDNEYSNFYKKQEEMLDQLNYEQQLIDKQVGKILFIEEKDRTAQFNQIIINEIPLPKRPPPIDLHEIALMFDQKLKSAISIINRRKGKDQINKENIEAAKSSPEQDTHKKEEDSIIYQLSAGNSSFNNTKNMSNSEYIREDLGDQEELFEGREQSREEQSNNTHDYRYQQIIEEQEEYDDYQPLFQPIPVPYTKPKDGKKEKNVTSFEEYNKKYTSVKQQKQQKVKSKAKLEQKPVSVKRTNPRSVGSQSNQVQVDISRNYYSSKDRQSDKVMTAQPHQQRKSLKSIGDKSPIRSESRDHSKSSDKGSAKQSRIRKPNFNQFFTAHRQHLQKIYSRIRGNISLGQQQIKKPQQQNDPAEQQEYYAEAPPKAADDMYILVLDELQEEPDMTQNQSTMEALNNEDFKEEIMKDYQKEILVSNSNLSSQDLIRYFKFLHSNAKKLYLKFLKNKK